MPHKFEFYKNLEGFPAWKRGKRLVQETVICFNCMSSEDGKKFHRVGITPDWEEAERFLLRRPAKLDTGKMELVEA